MSDVKLKSHWHPVNRLISLTFQGVLTWRTLSFRNQKTWPTNEFFVVFRCRAKLLKNFSMVFLQKKKMKNGCKKCYKNFVWCWLWKTLHLVISSTKVIGISNFRESGLEFWRMMIESDTKRGKKQGSGILKPSKEIFELFSEFLVVCFLES